MFRFAPSSTEDMHVGSLRTALFNFICAKQQNNKFIIRIDDKDKKRNIEGKDQDILEILGIFGIAYDKLYYQSSNFKYHLQFASTLLDQKKAFMCFCTQEEIAAKRKATKAVKKDYKYDGTCENLTSEDILESTKPFVIRIKKPKNDIEVKDTIKGELTFKSDEIDSFVIMEADKYPTYNYACAIDDMLQGVTYVIQSEENLLDAPKQEHIRRSLGYNEKMTYAHLPKILNDSGKNMSNMDDTNSVRWLLDQGFLPEALINHLVSLGNKTPKEIFTIEEALEWFDINLISKSPVKFNLDKLRFLNTQHIKLLSDEELAKRIGYSGKGIGKLAKLYAQKASTTFEIKQNVDAIFATKIVSEEFLKDIDILKKIIQNAPYFDEFIDFEKYLVNESGFEEKFLLKLLRILLTNNKNGPEFAHLYPLIKNYLKEIAR